MEKYIFDVLLKTDVVVRDRHDHTGAVCPDGLVALWARETLWPLLSNTGHVDTKDTKNTNTHRNTNKVVAIRTRDALWKRLEL